MRASPLVVAFLFGLTFACSNPIAPPAATPVPSATGTPAPKPSATATAAPTAAATPSPKPTATERPACGVPDGLWASNESDFLGPILSFRVEDCAVSGMAIAVYVIDGELYLSESRAAVPIRGNTFEYSETSGDGEMLLAGTFDSGGQARGTMTFTKGFDVFGAVLTGDRVIRWTAERTA